MGGESRSGVKPFLRWAGGKSWLVRQARALFSELQFGKYHEPFLGGAAIFFSLPQGTRAHLSDKNRALIKTYIAVRDYCDGVIECMRAFENSKDAYYRIREARPECDVEQAAQFIYLNQTSFNGIYRVNLNGVYNVPFGNRAKPFLDEGAIRYASAFLASSTLRAGDFSEALNEINENDLVFIDPPYTVSHNKNGFIKYNQCLFSLEDQHRLATFISEIRAKGANYILTNAAHETIMTIFGAQDEPVELTRANLIGGREAKRGHTSEYLFTNLESAAWRF